MIYKYKGENTTLGKLTSDCNAEKYCINKGDLLRMKMNNWFTDCNYVENQTESWTCYMTPLHVLKYIFENCDELKEFTLDTKDVIIDENIDKDVNFKDNRVNHPSHYNNGNIECIEAMIAAYGVESVKDFCICNSFKYLWRFKYKNKGEDIDKMLWYINKFKELNAKKEN